MDTQKIKELKERLSISLSEAKELLNESDDLYLCEQMYHRNNINTICRLTECDEKIAEEYYRLMKFDVQKAIKKINDKLFFYTAYPNETIDKIGFILSEENESLDKYVTSRDRSLFIPSKDFEIVLPIFKSMFPLKSPYNNEVQESFDIVSNNFFSNKACREMVQKMATIKTEDPNVELFLRNLIKWFQIRLRYADYIVVYGNL